jgi:arylsulfatase
MPFEGISMVYTFDNPSAPDRHLTQYFEIMANRSIYHDGWIAGARSGHVFGKRTGDSDFETQPWELYQLDKDYSERRNVAKLYPDKLKTLRDLFMEEARKNNVLPIDPRFMERRMNVMLPSLNPGRTVFTYYSAPHQVPDSDAPRVHNRSFTISADIVVPRDGGDGVIVCDGGRFGGYSLYVKNGALEYAYNFVGLEQTVLTASEKLPVGPVTVGFRFDYDGGGLGKGGTAALFVNGRPVGAQHVPRTASVAFTWYESFDVGLDAGTAVGDYASPFPFQGEIRTVVFNVSPAKLSTAAQAEVREGERLAEAVVE